MQYRQFYYSIGFHDLLFLFLSFAYQMVIIIYMRRYIYFYVKHIYLLKLSYMMIFQLNQNFTSFSEFLY